MRCLHSTRCLARLVLAWFVLSLGAAMAGPLIKPQAIQWVCSTGGAVKLVVSSDDGTPSLAHATLDCPLCMTPGAPPPAALTTLPAPSPLAHAVRPLVAAVIAGRTAAPLPPRGPPALT